MAKQNRFTACVAAKRGETKQQNMAPFMRNGRVWLVRMALFILCFDSVTVGKKKITKTAGLHLSKPRKNELIYLQILTNFFDESSTRANCRCGNFFLP